MGSDPSRLIDDAYNLLIAQGGNGLVLFIGALLLTAFFKDLVAAIITPVISLCKKHLPMVVAIAAGLVLVGWMGPEWWLLLGSISLVPIAIYILFHLRIPIARLWRRRRVPRLGLPLSVVAILLVPVGPAIAFSTLTVNRLLDPEKVKSIIYLLPPWVDPDRDISDEFRRTSGVDLFASMRSGLSAAWPSENFNVRPEAATLKPEEVSSIAADLPGVDVDAELKRRGLQGQALYVAHPVAQFGHVHFDFVAVTPRAYVRDRATGRLGAPLPGTPTRAPDTWRRVVALMAYYEASQLFVAGEVSKPFSTKIATFFGDQLRKAIRDSLENDRIQGQEAPALSTSLHDWVKSSETSCADMSCVADRIAEVRRDLEVFFQGTDEANEVTLETIARDKCASSGGDLRRECEMLGAT